MKFTIKTEHPTGEYRSFFPSTHYIKYKKKVCGQIVDNTWAIRLMVKKSDINEDGNPNCEWRWLQLGVVLDSSESPKEFLNENIDTLFGKFNIHCIDL